MINNKIIPSQILKMFMWEVLSINTDMTLISLPGLGDVVPIIPLSDEPMLAASGKSYIVYGYAENEAAAFDQHRRGSMALRITGKTEAQLTEIINTIQDLFEDSAFASEAVNLYSSASEYDLIGIRFTHVKAGYIEGAIPPDDEGETTDGLMNVDYRYIKETNIILPSTATGGLWT